MKELERDICEQHCIHPQTICLTKAAMLDDNTVQDLAEMFKILGDPTRIKILHALSRHELCVCDIAETLSMNQSAVSHQLRTLRSAKLVKFRKEGKEAWYSLDDDHVISLMCQGLEHVAHNARR
ncbi:metalloregulator ArsR/SmtB family transcription factor [Sporomusa sp.]|uniref:ArsR/SmtB family transcription factor n=1 Tax=Sporomusa sp. TaxID=2078658 RepID=UPI002BD04815|nr:metalloregulator ArsR/SmtB family transcription factor [Sporomusa sp.]HWR41721.1 metalloregulator ArsR/SmtB family transcription factor [Sporomusa sp.]